MISYYKIAEPYIEGIKEWFKDSYGIELSSKQVISFAIYTIKNLQPSLEKKINLNIIGALETKTVKIDEELDSYIRKELKTRSELMGYRMPLLITILIAYRYYTLPPKLLPKTKRISKKNTRDIPDSLNFVPKYQECLYQQIKQKIS